jgi:hypothetical protein
MGLRDYPYNIRSIKRQRDSIIIIISVRVSFGGSIEITGCIGEAPDVVRRNSPAANPSGKENEMVTILGLVLCVVLEAQPAPTHKGSDVELIANWVCGNDPAKAFAEPFGDSHFLTDRKDPLLYTDISDVKPPVALKAVNYEFIQARMRMIRGANRVAPAVLIVRSSLEEPAEGKPPREIRVDEDKSSGRVYYVEVAIGNLAWHWMKVVVWDEGDKPKAKVLWTKVS